MLDPKDLYHLCGRDAYALAASFNRKQQEAIDKANADRMAVLNMPEADLE